MNFDMQSPTTYMFWRQAIIWFAISTLLVLDFAISNRLIIFLLPNFLKHSVAIVLEGFILFLSFTNSAYCYFSYLSLAEQKPEAKLKTSQKFKQAIPRNASNVSTASNASAPAALNVSFSGEERTKHLSKVTTFLENFLTSPVSKTSLPSPDLGPHRNSSFSSVLNKDTSLSSTLGYHDSPLNRSVSSIYTQQQLDKLLAEDTCDTTADVFTHLFSNSFCDEDRSYKVGTAASFSEKLDDPAKQVEEFILSKQQQEKAAKKYSFGAKKISDSLSRFTRESSPLSSSRGIILSPVTGSSGGVKQRRHESELLKVFAHYDIQVSDVDEYELKLRVWICNTIIRPFIEKVDEVNNQLAEKFSFMHLKVGVSSLDSIKSNLSARVELCNTYLPFILPYLRIHNNQNYLVQRFRTLAKNVALEDFHWNSGGAEILSEEVDGISKTQTWSDRLPTDSELVWFAFCTYMDCHLSPCPNYSSGEFFKPFSNVYFFKADAQPTTLFSAPDSFFIRMASTRPPLFEFAFNGGSDVVVPNKESDSNLWLVMLLFLAHVEKFNSSRIGHLHLSAISLNFFSS